MPDAFEQPILPAGALTLLPLLPEHAPAMARWLLDPAVYTYLDDPPPTSVQVLVERYTRWQTRRSADGSQVWLNWAVRLDDTDLLIGHSSTRWLEHGRSVDRYR